MPSLYAGTVVKEWVSSDDSKWTNTVCGAARWIESSENYWVRSMLNNNVYTGQYYSFILDYIGAII